MLKLNIYDKKGKEIIETYETDTADIMLGFIEDFIEILEGRSIDDNKDLFEVIPEAVKLLKPLLCDIFDGVTMDELRYTKIKELIPLFMEIVSFSMGEIALVSGDSKNSKRVQSKNK